MCRQSRDEWRAVVSQPLLTRSAAMCSHGVGFMLTMGARRPVSHAGQDLSPSASSRSRSPPSSPATAEALRACPKEAGSATELRDQQWMATEMIRPVLVDRAYWASWASWGSRSHQAPASPSASGAHSQSRL